MPCSAYLQGGLIKNKGGVLLVQISQKRLFHLLWQPSALGVISQCDTYSCALQKRPSFSLQFGLAENIPGHSIEKRTYWFVLEISRMSLTPTSKNKMVSTFIIVNITRTYKRFHLPSPFSLARNRIYLGTHLKEELTNLSWTLPVYSLFPHR